jgi:signal transduction histidine kinase
MSAATESPGRILIVDDEAPVRRTLQRILQAEGYEVDTAAGLSEAIERLRVRAFDLVVTDQRLPENGMELLQEAQALRPPPVTIILTGYASIESVIEAIRKGAYDYLLKPCHPEELKLAVRRGLEHSRLTRSHALLNELRQRERQLQELSKKVLTAQEEERRRIARDLHDESAQSMTTLKIMLEMIRKRLPAELSELRKQVEEAEHVAARTLKEVRRVIADLRPMMLDDFGLIPTLRWLIQEFSDRHGIVIVLERIQLGGRLPHEIETVLYRVIQEALSNAVRHSGASRIWIDLERAGDRVMLEVRDNGKGFDPQEPARAPRARFGLLGIRERVAVLGGAVQIDSRPGAGTRLRATLPLTGWKRPSEGP